MPDNTTSEATPEPPPLPGSGPEPTPRKPSGFGLRPAWLFPARINRRHYILRYILSRLPTSICAVIVVQIFTDPELSQVGWANALGIFLLIIAALFATYTLLFVTFARLRDIGWPSWVILIPFLPAPLMPQLAILLQVIFEFGLLLIPGLGRTFWGRDAEPAN